MRLHSSNPLLMTGLNAGHLVSDWANGVAGQDFRSSLRPTECFNSQRRSQMADFALNTSEIRPFDSDRDNPTPPPASPMEP